MNTLQRLKEVTDALKDAISTYGPKLEILVTEERQEAWTAILNEHGYKEGEPDREQELAIRAGCVTLPPHIEAHIQSTRRAALREVGKACDCLEHNDPLGAERHAVAAHRILANDSLDGANTSPAANSANAELSGQPPKT